MADRIRPMRHALIAAECAEVVVDDPALLDPDPISLSDEVSAT